MVTDILTLTDSGLYCPVGDFYIDPWRPVDRAVVTHAHADHATAGSRQYLCSREGEVVFRVSLGAEANLQLLRYGERIEHNGVGLSLHPAGHILGSAQVRLEYRGQIAVVSGDYKVEPDSTCTPFEPVSCHLFVSESTFGLPIYRWSAQEAVFAEIHAWWSANQQRQQASVVFAYSLGKAQRLLAGLNPEVGPLFVHGAVWKLVQAYRQSGIFLPSCTYVGEAPADTVWHRALIVAPPSAQGSAWVKKFGPLSTAVASGWMRIRGTRRRQAVDRGFVLSDHADWPGLLSAIQATKAERVWVTHGYVAELVRYLREQGVDAGILRTQFRGEGGDEEEVSEA